MEDQQISRKLRQVLKKSHGEPTKLIEFIFFIQDMNREGKAASYPGIVRKMWSEEWKRSRDKVRFEKTKWDLLCKRRREINARLFSSDLCFNFYIELSPEKHFKILANPEEIHLQRHKELEWNLARERSKSRREKILQEIIELNNKSGNLEKEDSEEEEIQGGDVQSGVSSETIKTGKNMAGRRVWAALAMATIVVIIAAGLALKTASFRSNPQTPPSNQAQSTILKIPDKPSIAVLPFENMSRDPEQEYFSDGITEDIITSLAKVSGIFVISSKSSFLYKGRKIKIQEVAQDLGVRYVLEGSVRRAGDRVRINAKLIDGKTETYVWADSYDRKLKDIFSVQEEVTQKVVSELSVTLTATESERRVRKRTENFEAYDMYLRARRTWGNVSKVGHLKVQELSQRAIELDPNFAGGYGLLSFSLSRSIRFGFSKSPHEDLEKAYELAQKAVSVDDTFAEAYLALASSLLLKRRHDDALAAAIKATMVQPGDSWPIVWEGFYLHWVGRGDEAVEAIKKARLLNPQYMRGSDAAYLSFMGYAGFTAGFYEEAIEAMKQSEARFDFAVPRQAFLIASYIKLGRKEEARAAAQELLRRNPKFSLSSWKYGRNYKNAEDIERLFNALSKAELPE